MRQLIFYLIALLLVYGGWQLLCALRIGFRQQAVPATTKNPTAKNLNDYLSDYSPPPLKEPESGVTVSVYSHKQPNMAEPEKANERPVDSFTIELELQRLRLEISALREQVEAQQKEIESFRTSRGSLPEARIEPVILSGTKEPDTSPEYDEALALAHRGVMADVIASRCGITRAEADLVASLATRGQQREMARGVS